MTTRRDTGPAKLTGVSRPKVADSALQRWIDQISNWIETRSGSTGNAKERAVTERDLEDVRAAVDALKAGNKLVKNGVPVEIAPGLSAVVPGDKFIDFIRSTQLYRDLLRRLDDPTRYDSMSSELRALVSRSIADEAAKRGASISETQTQIQDTNRSFAAYMREITAAIANNQAGVREVQAAYVSQSAAYATKITQLGVSLGNYYQDGTPGRANLETTLTTQASQTSGLLAQYTVKLSAGGAVAGFGLAATEVDGTPSSAFVIQADKFAIVSPTYSGGLTNSPDSSVIPFGVDANGIYMNTNVYLKGSIRVDSAGKTLAQGMRGSMVVAASGSAWSDATASTAVWQSLGNAASPPNTNHLVAGDTVTISDGANPPTFIQTRVWTGSAWSATSNVFNGNLVVDGSLAASKIDTRNLTIRDAAGNIILSSGQALDYSRVGGAKPPSDADNTGSNIAAGIWSQGSFATVNQITSGNQSTLIADLAVGRLKLARVGTNTTTVTLNGGIGHLNINHGYGQNPIAVTLAWVSPASTDTYAAKTIALNFISSSQIGVTMSMFTPAGVAPPNGTTVQCFWIVI